MPKMRVNFIEKSLKSPSAGGPMPSASRGYAPRRPH